MLGILFAVLLATFGVAFVVRGFNGSRTGTTPHCGNCGFELTGLGTEAACPECGVAADLFRVAGRRAHCRQWMGSGIGLLIAAVVTLTVSSNFFLPPRQYYGLMPRFMLIKKAMGGDWLAADIITQRLTAGSLRADEVPEVIDQALVLRHGRDGYAWRDLMDTAYVSSTLDTAHRTRYIEESVQVAWKSLPLRNSGSEYGHLFFESIAGRTSDFDIDVEIISAAIDREAATVERMIGGDRPWFSILYPEGSAGKTLSVTWRVRYLSRGDLEPVAPDWVHSAVATIPTTPDTSWPDGAWLRGDLDPTVLLNEEKRAAWREQMKSAGRPD